MDAYPNPLPVTSGVHNSRDTVAIEVPGHGLHVAHLDVAAAVLRRLTHIDEAMAVLRERAHPEVWETLHPLDAVIVLASFEDDL